MCWSFQACSRPVCKSSLISPLFLFGKPITVLTVHGSTNTLLHAVLDLWWPYVIQRWIFKLFEGLALRHELLATNHPTSWPSYPGICPLLSAGRQPVCRGGHPETYKRLVVSDQHSPTICWMCLPPGNQRLSGGSGLPAVFSPSFHSLSPRLSRQQQLGVIMKTSAHKQLEREGGGGQCWILGACIIEHIKLRFCLVVTRLLPRLNFISWTFIVV